MATLAVTVIEPAIRDFGGVVADAELGHLAAEVPSGSPATEVMRRVAAKDDGRSRPEAGPAAAWMSPKCGQATLFLGVRARALHRRRPRTQRL
jgi:hypothetical protein